MTSRGLLTKVRQRIWRELHWPYRWYLRDCERGPSVCAFTPVRVENEGRIWLDRKVTFTPGKVPTRIVCGKGAEISIGAFCMINYGITLRALSSIRIGERTLIAAFVEIDDASGGGEPQPIVIGDGVWIAHGAVISPGVSIGSGSVVAAGSVVKRDVPADCLAIGNPARVVPLAIVAH